MPQQMHLTKTKKNIHGEIAKSLTEGYGSGIKNCVIFVRTKPLESFHYLFKSVYVILHLMEYIMIKNTLVYNNINCICTSMHSFI